ncbi:MAG: hypothetical protein AMJ79_04015 [Phycisphaerae bacterium SM23_30]|nr:MAG: hypothetical protein AMJ79_04015 [Phycisphaerae bacterium SM23_30]
MNKEQDSYYDKASDEQPMSENPNWAEATESELAAAEATEEEYAGPKRNFLNRGTLIIMASCLAGVAAIYLLGLRQQPQEASADEKTAEAQVDAALAKLMDHKEQTKAQELFKDADEMVQVFYDYPTKQQVALKELQRDPFSRMLAEDTKAKDEEDALKRQEKLRQELRKKAEDLVLQSVLRRAGGSQCMINGRVYREGDEAAGAFVVKAIKDGSVVLTADGMEFEVRMR